MKFTDYIKAVTFKSLVEVDLPEGNSNQHELNGSAALRDFFGSRQQKGVPVIWHEMGYPGNSTGAYTFYNARENDEKRTEWRLYYSGEYLKRASQGDALFIFRLMDDTVHFVLVKRDSEWFLPMCRTYGLEIGQKLKSFSEEELGRQLLPFQAELFETLGITINVQPDDEALMVELFSDTFPTTKVMSKLARDEIQTEGLSPDDTLVAWVRREEELFYALEQVIVGARLKTGFESTDDFISFSLSVQNRRKSRMGHAFENHIEQLFLDMKISYEKNVITERGNRPDFILPGGDAYQSAVKGAKNLRMLGVKSSVKERWRQVLEEADKILEKHLCTLDNSITGAQLTQMNEKALVLVLPDAVREQYGQNLSVKVVSVAEFIEGAREL